MSDRVKVKPFIVGTRSRKSGASNLHNKAFDKYIRGYNLSYEEQRALQNQRVETRGLTVDGTGSGGEAVPQSFYEGFYEVLRDTGSIRQAKLPTSYTWAEPALTIHRISNTEYTHNLDGGSGTARARIQIDCWAKDEVAVDDLAEEVRLVMQGYTGTMGSYIVMEVEWLGEVELHEAPIDSTQQWRYHVACDCMVDYRVSIPEIL